MEKRVKSYWGYIMGMLCGCGSAPTSSPTKGKQNR